MTRQGSQGICSGKRTNFGSIQGGAVCQVVGVFKRCDFSCFSNADGGFQSHPFYPVQAQPDGSHRILQGLTGRIVHMHIACSHQQHDHGFRRLLPANLK